LDAHRCCQKNVYFTRLDFLEVARGNLGLFGQLLLGHPLAHTLSADIRSKINDARPFFLAQRHDILHRHALRSLNDTLYREKLSFVLLKPRECY